MQANLEFIRFQAAQIFYLFSMLLGGISESGSYRSITHKRDNRIIQEIDLYDILINGNLLFKSPLRSGDSVIINPSQRLVAISGGINTPAIYELKDNETS